MLCSGLHLCARVTAFVVGSTAVACAVYDPSLLETNASGGSGATPSRGGNGGLGGAAPSGGSLGTSGSTGGAGDSGIGHSAGTGNEGGSSSTSGGSGGTSGGGSTASGGSGGSGGQGGYGTPELIDNIEDQNTKLIVTSGRDGYWSTAKDDTTTKITLAPAELTPARVSGSTYGWHITGSGFKSWGSMLEIVLRANNSAYDASAYCGVHFYLKGTADAVVFQIGDKYSEPAGKICDPAATSGDKQCYDKMITNTFKASADWTEIRIPFVDMFRRGFAISTPLAREAIYTLSIVFASDKPYDVFLDDIFFDTKPAGAAKCPGE